MTARTITRERWTDIELRLLAAAGQARCERDQRGAVIVRTSGPPVVVAHGWNGPPAGIGCTQRLCSPPDKVRSCAPVAEHAEAMAIRHCASVACHDPKGMDMVHANVVDNAIAVSRPPPEKACLSCAVMMRAWGVAGIWLFVDGRHTEPLGAWTRWSVDEYYRHATGTF